VVRGQELPTAYVHAKFEDRSFFRLRNIEGVPKFQNWVTYPRPRPLRGQFAVRGQELPTAYVHAKFEGRSFIRLRNIGTFRCGALIDPVTLTFDLLTLKSVWESHVTWGTPVQSFVFLGLLVFELEPMNATSDGQTDGRTDGRTTNADDRLMPPPPLRGRGHNNVLLVTAEATVRSTGPSQTHQQHSTSNNVLLVTAEVTVHWALTNTRTFYYCVSKKPDFTNSQHLVIIFNSQLTMLKSFFNCRRCGRSPSPTAWFTQNG